MIRTYNKAYKFRLLPTPEQEVMLAKTFGCVRFIWNQMLAYSINFYKEHGTFRSITPAQFKKEFLWLNEKIKSCTITMMPSGKYYVSILVEGTVEIKQIKPVPTKVIGLDFSMTTLCVSSEGKKANYPRYFRQDEAKLHTLSCSVSRKKKGSKNYQKARRKRARWYEHVTNKRNDFLHKLSHEFAQAYDAIIVEDLNMHNMSQALNFGKSVADNSWGRFLNFVEYKFLDRGKQFIKIDKWFPSSKMCSNCSAVKSELSLSERLYQCQVCGYIQDRDINAAINIRTAGMAGIAW